MAEGPSQRSGTGWEILLKVRDRLGDRLICPKRVWRSSRGSETGQGTVPEVQDGLGDPQGGPGWVWGHSRRFWTGWMTFPNVRDRVVGLSRSSKTGRGTLSEVRNG